MDEPFSHCLEMVRQQDHDRYLTVLHAPRQARASLAAIYAFNVELAGIRAKVREPILGEIRYQWWRERLEETAGGTARNHPVLQALLPVLTTDALLQPLLVAAVDARSADLDAAGPATLERLCSLADGAGGAVQAAALQIVAGAEEPGAPARAVGSASFLAGVLRALQSERAAAGFDARAQADVNALARAVCNAAYDRLKTVRRLPANGRSALLLAPLARHRLDQFRRAGYDLATTDFDRGEPARQLKLAWTALTGRY